MYEVAQTIAHSRTQIWQQQLRTSQLEGELTKKKEHKMEMVEEIYSLPNEKPIKVTNYVGRPPTSYFEKESQIENIRKK